MLCHADCNNLTTLSLFLSFAAPISLSNSLVSLSLTLSFQIRTVCQLHNQNDLIGCRRNMHDVPGGHQNLDARKTRSKSLEWPRKVRGMGISKPLFIITVNTEILSCALDQQLPDGSSLSILRLLLEMKTDSPRLFS